MLFRTLVTILGTAEPWTQSFTEVMVNGPRPGDSTEQEPEQESRALDDEECGVELLKKGYIQERWQSGDNEQQISGTGLFTSHAATVTCLHSSWLHARSRFMHNHHLIQGVIKKCTYLTLREDMYCPKATGFDVSAGHLGLGGDGYNIHIHDHMALHKHAVTWPTC